MTFKPKIIVALCCLASCVAFGQNSTLIVPPQIQLPYDSLVKARLLKSLNVFLIDKNQDLAKSTVVETKHYNQYSKFFDKLKDVEKSKKHNDNSFFKCYLKNVVLQPDKMYKIDFSYFGISPDNEVINKLNFSLLAKEDKEAFKFYCPFEANTKNWESKSLGSIQFYFKENFNSNVAADFEKFNTGLAKKMKVSPLKFKFYKCQDIQEVYKILGIEYDLSINGEGRSGIFDVKNKVFLAGTNADQYKHDLTHTYLGLKIADSLRNRAAEEGYAIYTTDYWGESPEQIIQYLKDYSKANPNSSLIGAFENNIYLKFPIPIKFPLSSVLVRKIERELGFNTVLELISCGKSDTQYFEKLEKLTGITRQTFDKAIKKELGI